MQEHLSSIEDGHVAAAREVASRGACVLNPAPAPTPPFVVATEWRADGTPVVSVTGELDLTTASRLEDALLALAGDAAGTVIVDLGRCGFMDLRGLHVLLSARGRFERSNRPLVLVLGNPSLLRVLKVTRVDTLFTIYPSLAAAGRDDHG